MPSNAPKDKLHRSLISKRLVGIVASTALLSLVSAAANAQTKFHNDFNGVYRDIEWWESNYAFQKPMILNSIGFYTNGMSMQDTSFMLNYNYSARESVVPASEGSGVNVGVKVPSLLIDPTPTPTVHT